MNTHPLARLLGCALVTCILLSATSTAQTTLDFSGLIFSDYEYVFQSQDGEDDGQNGFGYRRAYLTTDFDMRDSFSGRLRFESSDSPSASGGKPNVFIKDLWIRWKDVAGDGHHLTFGVTPPPKWADYESFQGYRSLEKTFQDRNGLASSRDMGIELRGPLTSSSELEYGLMIANNSGVTGEADKYKRVYGQIGFEPDSRLQVQLGGDYYRFEGGSSFTIDGFAGFQGEGFRAGGEFAFNPISVEAVDGENHTTGGSVFVVVSTLNRDEVILRADHIRWSSESDSIDQSYFLIGYAFSPAPEIRIIPNLQYETGIFDFDAMITGRLTVSASF